MIQRLWRTACATVCGLGMCCICAAPAAADDGPDVAFSLQDQRIDESSGLAASVRHNGVYWTHNDSGGSGQVFAVNGEGKTVATVRLRGVDPRDAEAIAAGRDSRGRPEVYLADIGDNLGGKWPEVWIYRFTEPRHLTDQTVDVTRFRVQYDDGPRNAETLLLDPSNDRLYIASKERHGGGLYQGPKRLDAAGVNTFTRVGDVPSTVTDGSVSPDASRLVLRGYFSATEYRWRSATGSTPARMHRLDTLSVPLQRQGESLTFTRDGAAVLFGSEGEGSQVWRLTLTGDHLPDRARKKASATADHEGGRHSDDASRHDDEDESSGTTSTTAAVLAVLAAVLIGVGRKRKKR